LIDNNFKEYLHMQTMNFGNWRIVDVDHFMKGNSFFNKMVKDTDWYKDVEAKLGKPAERV
jgi:hypothetical protein